MLVKSIGLCRTEVSCLSYIAEFLSGDQELCLLIGNIDAKEPDKAFDKEIDEQFIEV